MQCSFHPSPRFDRPQHKLPLPPATVSHSTVLFTDRSSEEKPNLTWSHPWGASPVAAIMRRLLGIVATSPGFQHVRIQPQLGTLASARGTLPTVRGPISVAVAQPGGDPLQMSVNVTVPGGVLATLHLPADPQSRDPTICVNGNPVKGVANPAGDSVSTLVSGVVMARLVTPGHPCSHSFLAE